MADLNELLQSKKVSTFVRKEKSRPWTTADRTSIVPPVPPPFPANTQNQAPLPKECKSLTENETQAIKMSEQAIYKSDGACTEPRPNPVQTQTKGSSKWEQTQTEPSSNSDHGAAPTEESQTKLSTQPRPQVRPKTDQTQIKVSSKASFSSVVGLQRQIILFVFDASKTSREKLTAPIALQNLADACQTTPAAAQVATRRLEKKELLCRGKFKNGRGGWTQYELPNSIFQELLQLETQAKLSSNPDQTQSKVSTQPRSQPRPSPLSSSSLINTTTTGNQEAAASEISTFKIPEELRKLGFSENHLAQLKRDSKLPLESISASIEALAYDLTFDDVRRKIRSPIGLIMKLLKAGELYLSEKGFESEADRLFRECVQRAEKQKEEKTKLMEKFFDLKFEEWIEPMANEDLLKISQPVGELKGPFHIQQLKEHFRKEVFAGERG